MTGCGGLARAIGYAAAVMLAGGCVTAQPYDYTNYRLHPPRSIVVLPPLNQSTAVEATYGYLTTVTRPLAERGYYVFPIAVVDQFLKENGLPSAGEMHQVPIEKLAEILGADAVLFITVEQYGTKYLVIDSVTSVAARARLVDTRTGLVLWEGRRVLQQKFHCHDHAVGRQTVAIGGLQPRSAALTRRIAHLAQKRDLPVRRSSSEGPVLRFAIRRSNS